MTDDDRAEAGRLIDVFRLALSPADALDAAKGRLAIVSKMLLAYPLAGGSTESGRARGEAYLAALDDVPPWAIEQAARRWHRGEAAGDHDYRWAPAPAVLRTLALEQTQTCRAAMMRLEDLTRATSLDEAMVVAASPADRAYINAGFTKLKANLRGPKDEAAPVSEAAE